MAEQRSPTPWSVDDHENPAGSPNVLIRDAEGLAVAVVPRVVAGRIVDAVNGSVAAGEAEQS